MKFAIGFNFILKLAQNVQFHPWILISSNVILNVHGANLDGHTLKKNNKKIETGVDPS